MTNVVDIQRGIAALDRQKAEAEAKERLLKPFLRNGAPYNMEAQAQRGERGLYHGVDGFFELGCALVLIKEHEERRTYAALLENRFRLPERAARFWEQFARLCVRSPKFQEFFNRPGMIHKGINLLAGLSEPEMEAELAQFEESGELLGLDEVALHTKTNKELKAENRRLRAERGKDGGETKIEVQRLKKRLAELQEEAGFPAGLEKEIAKLEAGEDLINEGVVALGRPDWVLLSKEAGGRARAKLLIDKLGRVAQWLESLVNPSPGAAK